VTRIDALGTTLDTRRNIPEDTILHSHRSENLKSYTDRIIYNMKFMIFILIYHRHKRTNQYIGLFFHEFNVCSMSSFCVKFQRNSKRIECRSCYPLGLHDGKGCALFSVRRYAEGAGGGM
jgi:hypothetical protein